LLVYIVGRVVELYDVNMIIRRKKELLNVTKRGILRSDLVS
jgi:hypothetical protein